ncbi:MAG: hypothetical protein ABI340_02500 [Nitrososphaera sp.]
MDKKLIGIGIGIVIAIAIIAISSYKTLPEDVQNPPNEILPNATQKQVTGKHITVELNESMSLSTR